ncbi:phosphotransferase [Streptomyces sp. ALI-76-A]|jgi:hygromycin-B 7''-O-kinase|uniref:phosphotransferase n=1 Tax=Streptomyces sp. ALI-76-A TaxID=3025736 RepID=UPI003364E6E3
MLPVVETDEEWDAVVPDETVMRAGAEDLCARLGLAGAPLTRFAEGSQPVYAVGDELVLKLFPTSAAQDGVTEARVLSRLHGRLPVRTPKVHDAGRYENGSDLLAYTLLHVYSNLPRYLRELHAPAEGSLTALAEAWFGTA